MKIRLAAGPTAQQRRRNAAHWRVLAPGRADLILHPAGGAINELLERWRTMVCAQAIENLV
jgi:predicted amidohydrolase